MLSCWYDEFLDEEDYWFLTFSVGGALSWGGIRRWREDERETALLEALFVKVHGSLVFSPLRQLGADRIPHVLNINRSRKKTQVQKLTLKKSPSCRISPF